MTIPFSDRFDGSTYQADARVTIAAVGWASYKAVHTIGMPERLFMRCQRVAQAYSLHLLGSADLESRIEYDAYQCSTVEDELIFVLGVVNDPLLHQHAGEFLAMVQRCTRHPLRIYRLVIVGPCDEIELN